MHGGLFSVVAFDACEAGKKMSAFRRAVGTSAAVGFNKG